MYKRLCILALTHGARVLAAPHMHFGSSNGSGSYTGPKCDSPQTRCRSTRALTSQCSSHAPRYQLPEDVRKSPVHPRIEMQDTGEQIRLRMRRTLAGTWHWKERLGQRPMATLMLQHCSKHWDQCAPARRQSARRTFDHLPPPPTWPVRLEAPATRCCTCCHSAAVLAAGHAVHDCQRCSLAPAPAEIIAGKTCSGTATHDQGVGPCFINRCARENDLRGSFELTCSV